MLPFRGCIGRVDSPVDMPYRPTLPGSKEPPSLVGQDYDAALAAHPGPGLVCEREHWAMHQVRIFQEYVVIILSVMRLVQKPEMWPR